MRESSARLAEVSDLWRRLVKTAPTWLLQAEVQSAERNLHREPELLAYIGVLCSELNQRELS